MSYVSRLERDATPKGLDEGLRSMFQGFLSGGHEGMREKVPDRTVFSEFPGELPTLPIERLRHEQVDLETNQ